jgi:hypothetical protein
MRTDFERELTALLHTVTPEPPDDLAAPRVATLPAAGRTDADATVIELTADTRYRPSRWHRWPVLASAAAVAALAAGVVAVIAYAGHSGAHRPAGPDPAISHITPKVATVPMCRTDQLVITDSPNAFTRHGRTGVAEAIYRNDSATRCALAMPSVAIGTTASGGTPFPAIGGNVRIRSREQLVITAHVEVTGQCHSVKEGLRMNLLDGPFTYSFPLGITGCTLTPVRVTHQLVG